jgi:gliding motility-associated-like protein
MKNYLLLYCVFVSCALSFGQNNNFKLWSLNASLSEELSIDDQGIVEYKDDWQEVVSERTLSSNLYKNSKGDIRAEYCSRPIHYYKNGRLEPIESTLKKQPYGYAAIQQPFPTYLNNEDGSFSLSLLDNEKLTIGRECSLSFNANTTFELKNNIAYFENYFEGVDKQIAFSENKVKYAYRIIESIIQPGTYTVISESIEFPEGYRLAPLKNKSYKKDGLIYGTIALYDLIGNQVAMIRPLLCFDAQNNYTLGGYRIQEADNEVRLELCVLNEWLSDSERSYPVIIDPEISGPASEWTGGDMPSCLLPNHNQDSILVTIPAGITVSGLFVSGSFYADPFSPAVMSDGVMYFSTSCDDSQNFTITGPTADLPGTAYLDSFDLKNPLSCCFPESCNDTSIYVSMHLARGDFGVNCNTDYVLYQEITEWPFRAVIYGKTPEVYGNEFYVSQASICSNTCTFDAIGYARYGVAPYTFTHPWTNEVVVDGENIGCGAGATNHIFTLTIPDCPIYCDENYTSLDIPPPVIIDACGQTVSGIPNKSKPVDPASNISAEYNAVVCDGGLIEIDLTSCLEGSTAHYFGNESGLGSISLPAENNSQNPIAISYSTFASLGDCVSDTTQIDISIVPNPNAEISSNPNPIVVNLPVTFSDASITYVNQISSWEWEINESNTSSNEEFTTTFNNPGEIEVCLDVMDSEGCIDSICKVLLVAPASIGSINVITSNNDGINDELAFEFLDFYPNNEIWIFNRWGNLIYNSKGYDNSWSGEEQTEGTYFYTLEIYDIKKTYSSFFHLKR